MRTEWSVKAWKAHQHTALYISREFGKKAVEKYEDAIAHIEAQLASNPRMGCIEPLLEGRPEGFRSIVVHKYCKMVYYIEGDILYIADLWDTRREPCSLVNSLK